MFRGDTAAKRGGQTLRLQYFALTCLPAEGQADWANWRARTREVSHKLRRLRRFVQMPKNSTPKLAKHCGIPLRPPPRTPVPDSSDGPLRPQPVPAVFASSRLQLVQRHCNTSQRNATLSAISLCKYLYFAFLSKPIGERRIHRVVRAHSPTSIVEIGIGAGLRTPRVLRAALSRSPQTRIRYTGIDLFEGRPESTPGLSLKQAHRSFAMDGASIKLVPGDPDAALARIANSLPDTDLVLIARPQAQQLAAGWFYLPRMLHEQSVVLVEGEETAGFQPLPQTELHRLAERHKPKRRLAA